MDFIEAFSLFLAKMFFESLFFGFELVNHELDVGLERLNFIAPLHRLVVLQRQFFLHPGF